MVVIKDANDRDDVSGESSKGGGSSKDPIEEALLVKKTLMADEIISTELAKSQAEKAEAEAKVEKIKAETAKVQAEAGRIGGDETGLGKTGFKITGGLDMGHIDLAQERKEASDELKRLKQEADESARATGQENQKLRDRIHEQEMKVITTSFEGAIGAMRQQMESKGDLASQISGIKALAKEFGMAQPDPGISDPALQIQVIQLEHAEAQRDREFTWQMQKDREAREDRKEEHKAEMAVKQQEVVREAKRDEMFANAPAMLGDAIGAGIMARAENKSSDVSGKPKTGKHIEAPVGEGGEADCSVCGQPVSVGPTARIAVCANCQTRFPIDRIEQTAPNEE